MNNRYYKILEIAENADTSEIKRAYRRLAKKYHPDINKSSDAHERFLEISEAYEFLVNLSQGNYVKKEYNKRTHDDLSQPKETYDWDNYYREKARERAQKQARMRYEQFKKQHEAFQKSGLYDIGLILNFIGNILLILLAIGLIFFPLIGMTRVVLKTHEWPLLFLPIFPLIAGVFIMIYIFQKRRTYFKIGEFYYTLGDIIKLYSQKTLSDQKYYYSKNHFANSKYFKVKFLKVLDIKLKSFGPRQHNINYKNKYEIINIPRSLKAFRIHTVSTIIKIISIILCLGFLELDSKLWRMIIGLFVGSILSQIIFLLSRTKSNNSYIFSPLFIIKLISWIIIIYLVSDIQIQPFNIQTTSYIQLVIVGILFFDSPFEQILKTVFGPKILKPIIRQPIKITEQFENGYQLYNEIPIWTVIFPIYKWIFG